MRVVSGGTTYFAHVDGLDPDDLERAAARPPRRCAASAPSRARCRRSRRTPAADRAPPEDVPAERKAELLRELDERGRAAGRRDRPVLASYAEGRREVTVANSDGLLQRRRPHPGAARRPGGGAPRRRGRDRLRDARRPSRLRAARRRPGRRSPSRPPRKALTLLDADPAPAGSMPVVVGGGFGGVLFHEMTGHGLEADHVQKGASVYAGKLGEQVAQPLLSAYDDGRLPGEWGSDAIDDEGTPTAEDAGDRGRPPHLLPLRPPAGRARRRRLDRQRPPRELPPPADPAHDQHLHRPRRRRARRR